MKILFCHNFYQQAGGEDLVVKDEMALLSAHGHEVKLYQVSNNAIKSFWQKLKAVFNLTYSTYQKNKVKEILRDFKPDIVHVHNFFPLITPSVFDACIEENIPVVHTLHNYRLLCPSATLFVNGQCNYESIKKSAYAMVKYKAYKNSYIGTFFLARAIEKYKKNKIWQTKIDRFIATSQRVKDIYCQAGFSPEKITVKPNFINSIDLKESKTGKNSDYAIFIGRLVPEKGIRTLITSWQKQDIELHVYGSGPLLKEIQNSSGCNVKIKGQVSREDVISALAKAKFLIMPTEWEEPFGLVVIEAFSLRIPVIASNIGAMSELIEHNSNGLLFKPNDVNDLQKHIETMTNNKLLVDEMSVQAIKTFNNQYTATINYPQLLKIYEDVLVRKIENC